MPGLLESAFLILAVTRLTRLVVTDKIGFPLRRWSVMKTGEQSWLTYALHCPWCVGMWFAIGGAPLWYYFGRNPIFVMICVALAISQAVGLLAKFDKGD